MGKKQTVDALVDGGKASAGPPIGSSLGPLKVNIGQVVAEINQKTKDFAGMKVPVKIIVDTEDKTFTITIGTPPASQLIKKEIGIESCSGEPHVNKIGAITFEQIIKVARMKQSSLIVNNLKSAVKTIAGSCQSSGILIDGKDAIEILKEIDNGNYDIDGKDAIEILKEIDNGNYDDLIKNEKTEPSAEKKKQMADLTKELLSKSESRKKEKAAAKAAAEAAAAAQATAAPATGTTPAATPGAKTAAPAKDAKPAPAAKKTEKK